ncbi:hypothetical protein BH11ACT8_BH11ACT8_13950 [soil metagenome]
MGVRERLLGGTVLVVAASALGGVAIALAGAAAAPRGDVEFRFQDPAIVESSGLVASDGLFVTVNDSGDTGRVFVVDPADGRTVGVTSWTADGAQPRDVEAVAPVAGASAVWVGDIGDNLAERASITVVRVPVARGDRTATPTTYELVYPGGARDAETLLVDPRGRLLVVTKGLFGGEVMIAPKRLDPDGPNRLRRIGPSIGVATDGAFFPDGRHLVVRSYSGAAVYTYPGLDEVGHFTLPDQQQGEGIAVDEAGAVFVSTEGEHTAVLRVRLPRAITAAIAPVPPPTRTVPPATGPADGSGQGGGSTTSTTADASRSDDGPAWLWLLGGLLVLGLAGYVVVATLTAVVQARRPHG